MTTIKTFIKPTQTLKLAILALSFGSTLADAGDMNPNRSISSIRPGDRVVLFNRANFDVVPNVAANKAIEFAESVTGTGVFGVTFVKGRKFDSHTFFNADNTAEVVDQYAACTLILEADPKIAKVEADAVPKIRLMNNIKNQKLTLTLKSEPDFSQSRVTTESTMVVLELVPVRLAEGTLVRIRCQFNKPMHIVKSEFKVSAMMEAFQGHASFQSPDPLSPRPRTGQ